MTLKLINTNTFSPRTTVITGNFSELALECPVSSAAAWRAWACPVPPSFSWPLIEGLNAESHMILAATTTPAGFALGCTLSGFAFGMDWPMLVLLSGEVFGVANVGANYMFFDGFSSAVGTLLLSKFLGSGGLRRAHRRESSRRHGDRGRGRFQCFGIWGASERRMQSFR